MPTWVGNDVSGNFTPCPEGQQRLVCCDIVDHGWVAGTWMGKPKMQPKVSVRFQSEHVASDGKPYLVSRRFTKSLRETSALRKFLNAWRGRPLTDDECQKFDLDKLIGISAYVNIVQERKPRGVFAEILSIMKLPAGMEPLKVRDYTRVVDEEAQKQAAAVTAGRQPGDDDAPF